MRFDGDSIHNLDEINAHGKIIKMKSNLCIHRKLSIIVISRVIYDHYQYLIYSSNINYSWYYIIYDKLLSTFNYIN